MGTDNPGVRLELKIFAVILSSIVLSYVLIISMPCRILKGDYLGYNYPFSCDIDGRYISRCLLFPVSAHEIISQ